MTSDIDREHASVYIFPPSIGIDFAIPLPVAKPVRLAEVIPIRPEGNED